MIRADDGDSPQRTPRRNVAGVGSEGPEEPNLPPNIRRSKKQLSSCQEVQYTLPHRKHHASKPQKHTLSESPIVGEIKIISVKRMAPKNEGVVLSYFHYYLMQQEKGVLDNKPRGVALRVVQ